MNSRVSLPEKSMNVSALCHTHDEKLKNWEVITLGFHLIDLSSRLPRAPQDHCMLMDVLA